MVLDSDYPPLTNYLNAILQSIHAINSNKTQEICKSKKFKNLKTNRLKHPLTLVILETSLDSWRFGTKTREMRPKLILGEKNQEGVSFCRLELGLIAFWVVSNVWGFALWMFEPLKKTFFLPPNIPFIFFLFFNSFQETSNFKLQDQKEILTHFFKTKACSSIQNATLIQLQSARVRS